MLPIWLTDTVTNNLDRAIHYAGLWGVEGLELRTLGRAGDRVPYVNEAKLKRRLAEYEYPVASIVPGMFEGPSADRISWLNELATLEEILSFCRRLDCKLIVVSGFSEEAGEGAVEALRSAGNIAARNGSRLAVLNEAEMACRTGSQLADLLARVDHEAVGAAWDPATALATGGNPAEDLCKLANRVFLVRCRDLKSGVSSVWTPCLPGEGEVDWKTQFGQLGANGYDGPVSMVVELEPRARMGLHTALSMMRLMRPGAKR